MKLWGSVGMQDEHLGFWSFLILFRQETYLSTLNQAFIKKHSGKPSSKIFSVGTRNKTFLTSTTTVDTQQMSKIQSRLVVKPVQKSFNQSARFIKSFVRAPDFRVPYDLKGLPIFEHTYPIIIKSTFRFPKFVSACKISAHFIKSFMRYSRF